MGPSLTLKKAPVCTKHEMNYHIIFCGKKKLYKQKKPPKYLNYMGSISLVIQSTDTGWVIPSVLYFAKMTWVHWHQDWVTIVCSPYFMFSNVRKKITFLAQNCDSVDPPIKTLSKLCIQIILLSVFRVGIWEN